MLTTFFWLRPPTAWTGTGLGRQERGPSHPRWAPRVPGPRRQGDGRGQHDREGVRAAGHTPAGSWRRHRPRDQRPGTAPGPPPLIPPPATARHLTRPSQPRWSSHDDQPPSPPRQAPCGARKLSSNPRGCLGSCADGPYHPGGALPPHVRTTAACWGARGHLHMVPTTPPGCPQACADRNNHPSAVPH